MDKQSGNKYYYNLKTNAVQWDRPSVKPPPPPPPPLPKREHDDEAVPVSDEESAAARTYATAQCDRATFKLEAHKAIQKLFVENKWHAGMNDARVESKEMFKRVARMVCCTSPAINAKLMSVAGACRAGEGGETSRGRWQ